MLRASGFVFPVVRQVNCWHLRVEKQAFGVNSGRLPPIPQNQIIVSHKSIILASAGRFQPKTNHTINQQRHADTQAGGRAMESIIFRCGKTRADNLIIPTGAIVAARDTSTQRKVAQVNAQHTHGGLHDIVLPCAPHLRDACG